MCTFRVVSSEGPLRTVENRCPATGWQRIGEQTVGTENRIQGLEDHAAGSRIFHPRIRSQSMKNNSPKNVIKSNPRRAWG